MATPSDIDALVGKVAGLYARTDAWKVRQAKGWRDTFRADAIGDLRAAVERWVEEHDDRAPTVAQVQALLRGGRKAEVKSGPPCGLCTNGWRIVLVRYTRTHGGEVEQGERAVACDCSAGDGHGDGPRLAGYLAWIDGGRCDAHGVPCGGRLVERIVDPSPMQRRGDAGRRAA